MFAETDEVGGPDTKMERNGGSKVVGVVACSPSDNAGTWLVEAFLLCCNGRGIELVPKSGDAGVRGTPKLDGSGIWDCELVACWLESPAVHAASGGPN